MFLARVFLFLRRLRAVVLFGGIGFGERFTGIFPPAAAAPSTLTTLPFKFASAMQTAFFAAFFVPLDARTLARLYLLFHQAHRESS